MTLTHRIATLAAQSLSLGCDAFAGLPLVQLEFQTRVPRVLAEPEPEVEPDAAPDRGPIR